MSARRYRDCLVVDFFFAVFFGVLDFVVVAAFLVVRLDVLAFALLLFFPLAASFVVRGADRSTRGFSGGTGSFQLNASICCPT